MPLGRPNRPISRVDVERAMKYSASNKGAARYLGVTLGTWKKNASRYFDEDGVSLYEKHKNQSGKGVPKLTSRKNKEAYLMDILEGRVSSNFVSIKRIKERLVEEGFMEECCNQCGYKQTRPLDEKMPLILNFLDNNKKNWRLENMEFLCYNCYFINVGDIFSQEQLDVLEVYQSKPTKKITQFELPPQLEESVEKVKNINNKHLNELDAIDKPEDYGSDLISFRR